MNISRALILGIAFVDFVLIMVILSIILAFFIRFYAVKYRQALNAGITIVMGKLLILGVFFALLFIILLLLLWVIYKVVRKIPLIGKIIIKKVPLFGACNSSGIFGFFDTMNGIVYSRDSSKNKFIRLCKGIIEFLGKGTGFLYQTAQDNMPIDHGGNDDGTEKKKVVKTTDPSFTQSDNEYMQDQLQMCLEENLIEVTPDMSQSDVQYANLQNQNTRTMCRTKQLQVLMDSISQKMPS